MRVTNGKLKKSVSQILVYFTFKNSSPKRIVKIIKIRNGIRFPVAVFFVKF